MSSGYWLVSGSSAGRRRGDSCQGQRGLRRQGGCPRAPGPSRPSGRRVRRARKTHPAEQPGPEASHPVPAAQHASARAAGDQPPPSGKPSGPTAGRGGGRPAAGPGARHGRHRAPRPASPRRLTRTRRPARQQDSPSDSVLGASSQVCPAARAPCVRVRCAGDGQVRSAAEVRTDSPRTSFPGGRNRRPQPAARSPAGRRRPRTRESLGPGSGSPAGKGKTTRVRGSAGAPRGEGAAGRSGAGHTRRPARGPWGRGGGVGGGPKALALRRSGALALAIGRQSPIARRRPRPERSLENLPPLGAVKYRGSEPRNEGAAERRGGGGRRWSQCEVSGSDSPRLRGNTNTCSVQGRLGLSARSAFSSRGDRAEARTMRSLPHLRPTLGPSTSVLCTHVPVCTGN